MLRTGGSARHYRLIDASAHTRNERPRAAATLAGLLRSDHPSRRLRKLGYDTRSIEIWWLCEGFVLQTVRVPLRVPQRAGPMLQNVAAQGDVTDILYKRSRFSTKLLTDRLYTASHFWLNEHESGVWRVGLTKLTTRMLGDVVDIGFDLDAGATVQLRDVIGWFEGFKARTDLYAVVAGRFAGGNPLLAQDVDVSDRDGYGNGWLYAVQGSGDPDARDAAGYAQMLDEVIDRMHGKTPEGRK